MGSTIRLRSGTKVTFNLTLLLCGFLPPHIFHYEKYNGEHDEKQCDLKAITLYKFHRSLNMLAEETSEQKEDKRLDQTR